jgi:dihydroxy-acid dehydratase
MQPSDALLKAGITSLPTIGDGRQSGTSGSPSILNASPEAAEGEGLALLQTGDTIRVDLNKRSVDMLVSDAELETRRQNLKLAPINNQTPWQEVYRNSVGSLQSGGCMELATAYQKVYTQKPRHNH